MAVYGLCDICRKRAVFTCVLCGKRVCRDCVTVSGACKACAGGFNIEQDKKFVDNILKGKGLDGIN